MRFFDAGQRAEGFIAIGQEAVGVIAIGQVALGVVAIGQLARGFFVVGQLAIGVIAIGQLSVGVFGGVGMMAIAGRWVKGLGVAIWPKPEAHEQPPKDIPLAQVRAGQPGFVRLDLELGADDEGVVLRHDGEIVEAELGEALVQAARDVVRYGYPGAFVRLEQRERIEGGQDVGYREAAPTVTFLAATKVVPVPKPFYTAPGFWVRATWRAALIASLGVLWFTVVVAPLWNALFASKTTMLPDIVSQLLGA